MATRAFPILEHKMREKKVKRAHIAQVLGRREEALSAKMSGKRQFTLQEAFLIRATFFPEMTVDELFGNPGPFKV